MARTKIKSPQLDPSKTVDANGWTVYDYGTHKEYHIFSPPAYSSATSLGGDQTGGPFGEVSSIALPVGITNLNQTSGAQMTGLLDSDSNNSCMVRFTGNPLSGTALPGAYIRNMSPSASTIQNVRIKIVLKA